MNARRWSRAGLTVAASAVALQMVPSVVSLGQWSRWRALPGGWCRWRGPSRPRVALTFDDGPDPTSTPHLLDALERLDLPATFFCTGVNAARHPELVAEMAGRGHQVETHGHRHDHHFVRTPGWIADDLAASIDALGPTGVRPRWYRPPYGQVTGPTMWAARRHHVELVLWSAWGREWVAPDSRAVAAGVERALEPGAIVLLHDGDAFSPLGTAARARQALGPIAEVLYERGLSAVTLQRLVDAP